MSEEHIKSLSEGAARSAQPCREKAAEQSIVAQTRAFNFKGESENEFIPGFNI